jgi:hypothetical protein
MKGSCEGWQRKWIGFSNSDGASNDAIKGKLDHKQAAAGRVSSKIIFIQSSTEESNGLNDSSSQAKASELNKMTTMTRPSKPRKSQNKRTNASGGGTKSKKTDTAPVFKAEKTNPFGISQTSVDFVVRGVESLVHRIVTNRDGTAHNITRAKLCKSSLVVLLSSNVSTMPIKFLTLDPMSELEWK